MKAIVLAAGKGKRLQSEQYNIPKVLRIVDEQPVLGYALKNISFIPKEDTVIVVGYKKEMIMDYVKGNYKFACQEEQLGTGHAVMMAEKLLEGYKGNVFITYGDMPLFRKDTFQAFIDYHNKQGSLCTLMTAVLDNPPPYGRIIRNSKGELIDIIETKDCSREQIKIKEINVGVYVVDSNTLFQNLKKLKNNNKQREYYMTDLPKILLNQGIKINTYTLSDHEEIYGVNTLEDLSLCEGILRKRY